MHLSKESPNQYFGKLVTSYGSLMRAMLLLPVYVLRRAYDKLERGTIDAASEFLMESNINRSPSSYLLNPQSERDKYADQGDTDKTMLLLKFMSDEKKPLGALNWFAVHGTSLNNTNLVRVRLTRV